MAELGHTPRHDGGLFHKCMNVHVNVGSVVKRFERSVDQTGAIYGKCPFTFHICTTQTFLLRFLTYSHLRWVIVYISLYLVTMKEH